MKQIATYDRIGQGYSKYRRADPRMVDAIVDRLDLEAGDEIAEIGAGSGNYSRALADRGFRVHAIEPSNVMRDQAEQHLRVNWLDGVAEEIPLPTRSVAGVVAILSLHHFSSARQAAGEMMRISSGPIVIFTHDPRLSEDFWLCDYFPEIFEDGYSLFPPLADIAELFEMAGMIPRITAFLLPHDLQDLFLAAGWHRPEIYLDPEVRSCMSAFALAEPEWIESRIERLRKDITSGDWDRRYGSIRRERQFDAGYRLLCLRPHAV